MTIEHVKDRVKYKAFEYLFYVVIPQLTLHLLDIELRLLFINFFVFIFIFLPLLQARCLTMLTQCYHPTLASSWTLSTTLALCCQTPGNAGL